MLITFSWSLHSKLLLLLISKKKKSINNTEKNLNFKIHYIKNSNLIIKKNYRNEYLTTLQRTSARVKRFWPFNVVLISCLLFKASTNFISMFSYSNEKSIKKLGQEHPLFCSLSITLFIHLYKIDFITKCRIVINHVTFCVDSMNYMSMTIMSVLIFKKWQARNLHYIRKMNFFPLKYVV